MQVLRWLEKYKQERDEKTPAKMVKNKRDLEGTPVSYNNNRTPATPLTPIHPSNIVDFVTPPPLKKNRSKRGLGPLLEQERKSNLQSFDFFSPASSRGDFSVIQSPPEFIPKYIDENFYSESYLSKPVPCSPLRARVLRNTQNFQTPVKVLEQSCRTYDVDGIRPLCEADDDSYTSLCISSLPTSEAEFSFTPETFLHPPEQLLEEDSPLKKISYSIPHYQQQQKNYPSNQGELESTKENNLPVPVSCHQHEQKSSITAINNINKENVSLCVTSSSTESSGTVWRMRQPKKRWLQEAQLQSKLNSEEGIENKEKLMGAMALVQLAELPPVVRSEESLQPLNLTTNRCSLDDKQN